MESIKTSNKKVEHILEKISLINSQKHAKLVENLSDNDIWKLNDSGHDPVKVYAAYKRAVETKGRPTVISSKNCKRLWNGSAAEGMNIAHGVKK
ncbi:hypothetical protein MASR2M54_13120 [Aliarcobacter cryaerophilus]